MRTIRVAIAGLGIVGRETVRLLLQNKEKFAARLGTSIEIAAVCDRAVTREARLLGLPASVARVKNPNDLARLPGPHVIVEVLGGVDAAHKLVLSALRAGRHVVTANKWLLSEHWDELNSAASKSGARLYYEASVAGGIPLLQSLDNGFAANRIEAVYGILNGTTNYILTRAEAGLSPAQALREAQLHGFAEKNPAFDLSGRDTAQKVSVLASLITGRWIKPRDIPCVGINAVEAEDISFARATLGRTVKLIGSLRLFWGKTVRVEASVAPTLVPLDHPLAAVRNEYNGILVKTSEADDLMFYGKGAGAGPTASAVVGDVFMLTRDILGGIPPRRPAPIEVSLAPADDSVSAFYLRLFAKDEPGVLAQVTAALGRRGISIASIHQSPEALLARREMPIVILTYPTTLGQFNKALGEIFRLKTVARRHTVLRLLQ